MCEKPCNKSCSKCDNGVCLKCSVKGWKAVNDTCVLECDGSYPYIEYTDKD